MKISTYRKAKGDTVAFVRGMVPAKREAQWDRIYISSLFTWELPKTVKTVKYYFSSVANPKNIFVGGTVSSVDATRLLEAGHARLTAPLPP